MIHGLIRTGLGDGAGERVDRIVAERHGGGVISVAQVLGDGLAHQRRDARASPVGLVAQFLVPLRGNAKIRGRIPRHTSGTISRYRF